MPAGLLPPDTQQFLQQCIIGETFTRAATFFQQAGANTPALTNASAPRHAPTGRRP